MKRALATVAAWLSASGLLSTQGPVFRSSTDLVVVDVSVSARRQAVDGLTSGDFLLRDNGVEQAATISPGRSVPIDLSLLVATTVMNTLSPMHFWADAPAVNGLLRPSDRLAITTFGSVAYEQLPLTPVPVTVPSHLEAQGGWAILHGALLQSLMLPSSAGRRHLILVLTTGSSLADVVSPKRLTDVARRSDALVYIGHRPTRAAEPDVTVAEVADLTGGAVFNESDLVPAVKQLLALLDHSYVLTYRPQGVTAAGWHAITVTLKKPGNFTIRARRGYYGSEAARGSRE